jgi:hypothetical protein
MTDRPWRVAFSQQLTGVVGAIQAVGGGVAVGEGTTLRFISNEGNQIWKREMPFSIHSLAHDGAAIGVLCGHGFHLLDQTTGQPLYEGRSVAGGFRKMIARPGGGWVLMDRGEHLHLFSREGRGIRRVRPGPMRHMIGWLDREHLMIQNDVGMLCCLRLFGSDSKRVIERRSWSWTSQLEEGRVLLQTAEGSVWEGVPNPFGWDSLERVSTSSIDPLQAHRCGDGWWILQLSGEMIRLPPLEEADVVMEAGVILSSNGADVLVGVSREGLLRWWEEPTLADRRHVLMRRLVKEERRRLDFEQREVLFEAARDAEDSGQLQRAVELYEALGRKEDVRRLLVQKEALE